MVNTTILAVMEHLAYVCINVTGLHCTYLEKQPTQQLKLMVIISSSHQIRHTYIFVMTKLISQTSYALSNNPTN